MSAPGREQEVPLGELWSRLDAAVRKLWQEDRVSAIPVQAAVEELKVEWERLEQLLESLKHSNQAMHQAMLKQFEQEYRNRLGDMEEQLRLATSRVTGLEESLGKERSRVAALLEQIERQEAESTRFKQEGLRAEADREAARTRFIEEFQRDLEAKSERMERSWTERLRSLEADFRARRDELESAYSRANEDLQAREARCYNQEIQIKQQADELSRRASALEKEYMSKRAEIETLKARMQAEITELIRSYQEKWAHERHA